MKVTKATNAKLNAARGLGRGQTSGQELLAQKESARIAVQQAQFELDTLEEKLRIEKIILAVVNYNSSAGIAANKSYSSDRFGSNSGAGAPAACR